MTSVLVVGGGPAGLATASSILERNSAVDVTVVDKKLKAGEPPQRCAGGVSRFGLLEKADFIIPTESILAQVNCFRLYAPNGAFWDFKSDEVVGYVLDREAFEFRMAERVERLGAEFVWNHNVTKDTLPKLSKKYNYVIGCDGYPSVVGDWVGASKPPLYDVEHCVQKVAMWQSFPQNRIDIYFGSRFPQGYGWVFPKGNSEVRIGLGVALSLGANVKALLDFFSYYVSYDLEETELISKLLPVAKPRKSNVFMNSRVLLVGDAGLHVDPAFGGGIIQAICAGKACGKAIAEGKPYKYDEYVKWLKKENKWRYRVKKVLVSLSDEEWNSIVKKLGESKPVFEASSGKVLRKVAGWMMLRKPKLLWKFLSG